ncbi:hypothetical protein [Vibrio parahaemolyticus]|uniref:hypothetical protein n=1 Tax=Vibrio parahaemolyticus TaxID=670 RepID=UPI000789B606|nr:hypothetical protein [Vibrio parahaemolyticus]KYO58431.1 hypothetical protein AU461_23225 [Vibrio parahaemolyticus]KYX47754.1 hypothetical protein AU389_02125 [Vibrio parahaemolyticus]TPB41777.1 hypothetical protein DXJ78_24080 [Vibrio parahaemolyticus]
MNNALTTHNVICLRELPKMQRQVVRQVNREAAALLAVEALAEKITDLSQGTPTAERLDQIQQYAEAMLYNLEDARARLGGIALTINDIQVSENHE